MCAVSVNSVFHQISHLQGNQTSGTHVGQLPCNTHLLFLSVRAFRLVLRRAIAILPPWKTHKLKIGKFCCLFRLVWNVTSTYPVCFGIILLGGSKETVRDQKWMGHISFWSVLICSRQKQKYCEGKQRSPVSCLVRRLI